MAITESGLYVQNFVDTFDATTLAFNYIGDTMRNILITDSEVPNFSTDTAYADVSANEVGNSGSYAAKGDALGTKLCSVVSGAIAFDAADTVYTTATITAMAAVIIDDTMATPLDGLICLLDFVTNVTSTAGSHTTQYATNGFIQIPHV